MNEEQLESWIQHLRQEPRAARLAAVQALSALADPRAVEALAAALYDGHKGVRRCAARALGKSNAFSAAQALIAALRHEDIRIRRYAARWLSTRRDPAVAAALLEAFWKSDYWAGPRWDIIGILAQLHDPGVIEALVEQMQDPFGDRWMRASLAARALREMAEPLAAAGLMAIAAQRPGHFMEQGPAIRALAGVKTPEVLHFLIGLLASEANTDQMVKRDAAWALGEMKAPEAVPALIGYLGSAAWPIERQIAIKALARIRDTRAVPPLLAALNHYGPRSKHLRKQAARALASFDDPEIIRTVARDLQDPSADQRARAAWALGEIADPRALPALQLALEDADARVRDVAAAGLQRIRTLRAASRPSVR